MDVPELLDYVIDFLHDDSQSLRACSIVCHAWSASARFHLFETISITRNAHFADLSASTVPFKFSSVRRILLVGMRSVVNTLGILEAPYWKLFTRLNRLCIMHIGTTSIELEEQKLYHFFLNFPLLRVLTIGHCDFTSPRAVIASMRALPRLFALEIYGTNWGYPDLEGSTVQSPLPFAVRHLRISGGLPDVFIKFLLESCPVLEPYSLSLGESGISNDDFNAVLTRCSKSLRMINLLEPTSRCVADLDMSMFPNLNTIILPSFNPQRINLPARILSTTVSEKVHRVCILLPLEGNTTMRNSYYVGFGEIDDILASSRFRNAIVFVGVIPGWGNRNEDKEEVVAKASCVISRMLPKCSALSVLVVEHFQAVAEKFDIGGSVTRYADRPISSWVSWV